MLTFFTFNFYEVQFSRWSFNFHRKPSTNTSRYGQIRNELHKFLCVPLQSQIWKSVDESSVSSLQSLDGDTDIRHFTMQRDTSLDR